ncbi:MAG: hypothetical protein M3464_05825 [Chloroflexota bacterium]|nr:hypothetical protein [Chloroflexota bacterium]
MDDQRFDHLSRRAGSLLTRRVTLTALLGALVPGAADAALDRTRGGPSAKVCRRRGRRLCDKKCRDLRTDRRHCGKCGKRCQQDERCIRGRCVDKPLGCDDPDLPCTSDDCCDGGVCNAANQCVNSCAAPGEFCGQNSDCCIASAECVTESDDPDEPTNYCCLTAGMPCDPDPDAGGQLCCNTCNLDPNNPDEGTCV